MGDAPLGYGELARQLAERGVSPGDGEALLGLTAVGVTRRVWHEGPVGSWLASEAPAGEVLRCNVATTKLVRLTLATCGYDLEAVFHALTGDRVLPTGQRFLALAGDRWAAFADHAAMKLGDLMADVDDGGTRLSVLRVAAHAVVVCPHWWGTPWWPQIAERVVAAVAVPGQRDRPPRAARGADAPRPPRLSDARLADALLAGPDRLERDEAAWVVGRVAASGCHVDGYARWRAHHSADPRVPFRAWDVVDLRPDRPCPCGSGLRGDACHAEPPPQGTARRTA